MEATCAGGAKWSVEVRSKVWRRSLEAEFEYLNIVSVHEYYILHTENRGRVVGGAGAEFVTWGRTSMIVGGEVSLLEAKFDRWGQSFLVVRFKSKVCKLFRENSVRP